MPTPDISSIYRGIREVAGSLDLQGWGSDAPIFRQLIEQLHPKVVIEVGSHKGASVIHMAKVTQELRIPTVLYAVDFWQDPIGQKGDNQIPTHWSREISAYHQFLLNVSLSEVDDRIIPVRCESSHAWATLAKWGVTAELIYIDAGHTIEAASLDIDLYWKLLRPGGVMFGHDFAMAPVEKAVRGFGHPFVVKGEHWQFSPK